jgi:ubiquinone/menaquinone biosynthesis C-methylase UbiE
MTDLATAFTGSIPAIYDECLGPLFFEFSATDLAERVAKGIGGSGQLLEIACGTGISTQFLRERLPDGAEILATDLNPAMLDFAKQHRGTLPGVRFEQADALALPFEADRFDAVACQFGIMFFPDIPKGLAEMRRVLRPGGFFAVNVWASIAENPVVALTQEMVGRFFDSDPPRFIEIPFGRCALDPTREQFEACGFVGVEAHVVDATVERPSAAQVARGLVEGNPGIHEVHERANASPAEIEQALAEALESRFGPPPLRIPLREFVFTGNAPA